jgi:asparagine synthase (glutamine-hydrolysing)
MRDVITHRGPDEPGCTATSTRLSPIAVSASSISHRTAAARERRRHVWVIFNGEIYNHARIRRELEQLGHVYRTKSDTETIVHAYEQWGDDCVAALPRDVRVRDLGRAASAGFCSSAIASGSSRSTGRWPASTLLFGSEMKALLAADLASEANIAAPPGAAQHRVHIAARDAVPRRAQAAAGSPAVVRAGEVRVAVLGHTYGKSELEVRVRTEWQAAFVERFRNCSKSRSACA